MEKNCPRQTEIETMDANELAMGFDNEMNSKFMANESDASTVVPEEDDQKSSLVRGQVMVLDEFNILRRISEREELLKHLQTKPEATPQNPKAIKALDHLQNRNVEKIQHFSDLGEYMKQLQSNKEICDVEIRINKDVFSAHRIALACFSPYFLDFFTKNARKFHVPMAIRIYGVSADVFQVFLEFVYNREIRVNVDNLVEVMKMADGLGVRDLKEHCLELLNGISVEKAIQILRDKQYATSKELTRFIISRIAEGFSQVYNCDAFYELGVTDVCRILSNNDLQISTETEVYRVALKWIVYSIKERRQYLCKVMMCVRYQHMTQKELFECVEVTDLLKGCPVMKKIILRANWVITAGILEARDPLDLDVETARTCFTENQTDRSSSCENCCRSD